MGGEMEVQIRRSGQVGKWTKLLAQIAMLSRDKIVWMDFLGREWMGWIWVMDMDEIGNGKVGWMSVEIGGLEKWVVWTWKLDEAG